MWGLYLAGSAAPGHSAAGMATTTPGAVCGASACGEVSVAYAVVNFAFGNRLSLIVQWCVLVSLLR